MFRIYSKRGDEKAYLRVENDAFSWVRSWRDATAWHSPIECDKIMVTARAREPERPMCRVMWGTRHASLDAVPD